MASQPMLPLSAAGGFSNPVIAIAVTLAGDVADFDTEAQDIFRSSLAALIAGVNPSDITLTVTLSSINIRATILMASVQAAEIAAGDLGSASAADLSAALGVNVESIDEIVVSSVAVEAPSAPTLSPPTPIPLPGLLSFMQPPPRLSLPPALQAIPPSDTSPGQQTSPSQQTLSTELNNQKVGSSASGRQRSTHLWIIGGMVLLGIMVICLCALRRRRKQAKLSLPSEPTAPPLPESHGSPLRRMQGRIDPTESHGSPSPHHAVSTVAQTPSRLRWFRPTGPSNPSEPLRKEEEEEEDVVLEEERAVRTAITLRRVRYERWSQERREEQGLPLKSWETATTLWSSTCPGPSSPSQPLSEAVVLEDEGTVRAPVKHSRVRRLTLMYSSEGTLMRDGHGVGSALLSLQSRACPHETLGDELHLQLLNHGGRECWPEKPRKSDAADMHQEHGSAPPCSPCSDELHI